MKLIKEFTENEKIKQNFLINNVTKGVTTKGSAYYNVVLQDASGTIEGKKWEIVDGDENVFKIGNIVEIAVFGDFRCGYISYTKEEFETVFLSRAIKVLKNKPKITKEATK